MKLSRMAACVLFFIVALTGMFAIAAEKTNGPDADGVYTEDKQNIFITSTHPMFTLKLKSNPTTGYSWFLREHDASLIAPVKHRYQASAEKLMGAPGYELWTFKVKPAGFVVPQQTTVRLIYARPWQSADSATQIVFRITTGK